MKIIDKSDLIEVRNSGIHGYGLFAAEDINIGELLIVIKGEVIGKDEALRRETEENNVYIFYNGSSYIDTVNTAKIKYINHSCEPNCEVKSRSRSSLKLMSIKRILKGDEITIDYGFDEIYDECNCLVCSEKAR